MIKHRHTCMLSAVVIWAAGTAALASAPLATQVHKLEGHTGAVTSVSVHPGGKWAATGSRTDPTVLVWDLATGKVIHRLEGHTGGVAGLTAGGSRSQQFLYTCDRSGMVWSWEFPKGPRKKILSYWRGAGRTSTASLGHGGEYSLMGPGDNTVRLFGFRIRSMRRGIGFNGHTDVVTCVALSPSFRSRSKRQAVTGSRDKTVRLWLWDEPDAREIRRVGHHDGAVTCVAFSRGAGSGHLRRGEQRWVLSGGEDNVARLWELATGKEVYRLAGHTDAVVSAAISDDWKWALTGGRDNTARLWDLATGKEARRIQGHTGAVVAVAFTPNGKLALTGSTDQDGSRVALLGGGAAAG